MVNLNKLRAWAEQHPQLVILVATALLGQALWSWHDAVKWAEGQMQIEASEFYGG